MSKNKVIILEILLIFRIIILEILYIKMILVFYVAFSYFENLIGKKKKNI
jgi:hypothetical protein